MKTSGRTWHHRGFQFSSFLNPLYVQKPYKFFEGLADVKSRLRETTIMKQQQWFYFLRSVCNDRDSLSSTRCLFPPTKRQDLNLTESGRNNNIDTVRYSDSGCCCCCCFVRETKWSRRLVGGSLRQRRQGLLLLHGRR